MDVARRFAEELMKLDHTVEQHGRQLIEYWNPEQPPITVLFAALGKSIARAFPLLEAGRKRKIGEAIEQALQDSDPGLRDAVATGLLEAMVAETQGAKEHWISIEDHLLPAARDYVRRWRAFTHGDHPQTL